MITVRRRQTMLRLSHRMCLLSSKTGQRLRSLRMDSIQAPRLLPLHQPILRMVRDSQRVFMDQTIGQVLHPRKENCLPLGSTYMNFNYRRLCGIQVPHIKLLFRNICGRMASTQVSRRQAPSARAWETIGLPVNGI